ncbi:MAG: CRISPR-associated helicase Cas3' [Desulfovibrionaceae bacterium]
MFNYWGKTRTEADEPSRPPMVGPPLTGHPLAWHPLACHCLDVAAVAQTVLAHDTPLRDRLARIAGMPPHCFTPLCVFLIALHDCGKFAPGFQWLAPHLAQHLQPGRTARPYVPNHRQAGGVLLARLLASFLKEGLLPLEPARYREWFHALKPLAHAVAWHHGKPEDVGGNPDTMFDAADKDAATAFAHAAASLVIPPEIRAAPLPFADTFLCSLTRASWWVAGLCTLCDWIGSDAAHFPPDPGATDAAAYWRDHALPRAAAAVAASGIVPSACAPARGFHDLFPHLPAQATPSPLQRHVLDLPAPTGPTLHIFEDATGAGKTEAALAAAHGLMRAGQAHGLFIGLPTMATADAMYTRLAATYRRLFAAEAAPSLVLAHGSRDLAPGFAASIGLERIAPASGPAQDNAGDDAPAQAACAAWLADSRKKALLADAGVGTIDQALLAALPSAHQCLRLLGLARSVLVVDEVHACDEYMLGLLCALLEFHAAAGGSAILLSATLPASMRQRLADAFCKGLDTPPARLASQDYPLAVRITGDAPPVETRIGVVPGQTRRIATPFVHTFADAAARVLDIARRDACACWMRNTVADAMEAYDFLRNELGDARVTLFHARFAVCDRRRIEDHVLAAFGVASRAPGRAGRVVVATQVAEQSLNVDWDAGVTDLAPMDRLIQRFGRFGRHARPDRPPGFASPVVAVYSPPPVQEAGADWYKALFPGGAAVYPDHGRLWLTARLLAGRGGLAMPDDARALVEAVYGPDAEAAMPEALAAVHRQAEGNARGGGDMARFTALPLGLGYTRTATHWLPEAYAPTRLGERTVTLRLARWDGQTLRPWAKAPDGSPLPDRWRAWRLSEISVRERAVACAAPCAGRLAKAVAMAMESMPDACRWSVLLPLAEDTPPGAWRGAGLDLDGMPVTVLYSAARGLWTNR